MAGGSGSGSRQIKLNINLSPGGMLIVGGALLALIFSFFDFYSGSGGFSGISSWGRGLIPVATVIVFLLVAMALVVVLTQLANVDLGSGIAGFSWGQVLVALGFFALLDSFCFLIVSKGALGIGVGLIFSLIGSIAGFIGAILESQKTTTH